MSISAPRNDAGRRSPIVVQTRGSVRETEHPFVVAVAHAGSDVDLAGVDRVTPFRSAAKPFQLANSLGFLGDPDLTDEELAIGAASHSAEPRHVELARKVLSRFGVPETGLRCGGHAPMHAPSAEALVRSGEHFTDIHNNCSGKHAFMLAAAVRQGWEVDYRPSTHPLQVGNSVLISALSGWDPQLATDGCGVPTFCLPVTAIARAWSVLAAASPVSTMGRDPQVIARLSRVANAMAVHPELTSGEGRLDLLLAETIREPYIGKIGAQGVFCIALPKRGLGIAVKVTSGLSETLAAAVPWALQTFAPGAFDAPLDWPPTDVRNVVGALVGRYQVEG
ncbi:MAG: asparaginase [Polyangiaceae bacterium]|nr:asparaginase [Polyangiaceae bacterium]